jgi:hypothetical protein
MIKRRARSPLLDLLPYVSRNRHTTYLENGGTLEHARTIANH